MTQGNPPPIPRRPIPTAPVQAAPVAAIPVADFGGHVGYSTPRAGRPGMISAIGIISIIVASLSMLGGIGQAFYVVIFYTFSQSMAAVVPPPAPPVAPSTMPTGPSVAPNARGFSPEQRDAVIAGLKRVRSLSAAQVKNVDALLEACGQDVILLRGAKLTGNNVVKNVSDSGTLPSATGDEGPAYFVLGQGRIEVSDAQAAFFPTQGEVVRASAEDAGVGTTYPSGSTDAEIKAVLLRVQQLASPPLNAAQITGLTTELQSGSQNLFIPSPSPGQAGNQIRSITPIGNGSVHIQTSRGWIQFDPQGNVVSSSTWAAASSRGPMLTIDHSAALLLIFEGLASFLLAIYLLVIGILTLRQSPRGGRLHTIYAVIKIPLAILSGVGVYWLMAGLFASFPGGAGPNPVGLAISASMGVVVACIYPIALLITLRTRAIREYYATANTH